MKTRVMKTRVMMLAVTMVVVALAGSAGAAVVEYVDTGDGLWSTLANWSTGGLPATVLPTALDEVQISNDPGSQAVTIGNGVAALADDLHLGYSGDVSLTVLTGGTLTVSDIMATPKTAGITSEINLNGGTITLLTDKFRMDLPGGTLNMTDGLLDIAGYFDMRGAEPGAKGTVNVHGGTIEVGSYFETHKNGMVNLYDGATINMAGDLKMNGSSGGKLDMFGGNMTIGDDLEMGSSDATVNMSGGTMIIESLFKMNSSNNGTFNLIDGTVTAEEGQGLLMTGGLIDIVDGTLILPGDVVSIVDGFIGNGWITAYGGSGTVMVDTTTNPGQTTVYAVPEPATMCLLGLGGLMLRRRRKA